MYNIITQEPKYSGVNLEKHVYTFYSENYVMLMKEIKK